MASITFDTLKFTDRLTQAGVPEAQARAEAEALQEVLQTSEVSTKSDLREMEIRLIKWMVGFGAAQVALLVGVLLKLP